MDNKEILLLTGQMKSSKACGPNSMPGKRLIEFSELLAYPLVSIINMSLNECIFPNLNKIATVCPIHKKVTRHIVKTIDQFHFFLTLVSYSKKLCMSE